MLELGGAIVADSVVLQADALHLLMDVLALAVSLLAMRLAVRRPTPRFTYGLRRAEPVAAIFSARARARDDGGHRLRGRSRRCTSGRRRRRASCSSSPSRR